jgi:integrase
MNNAVAAGQGTAPALLAERARDYFRQAKAASTCASYARDWRDFCGWCRTQGRLELPAHPETVALYLTDLAETRKVATLEKRLAAISQAHQFAGYPSPTQEILVRTVMAGIRRAKGTAQPGKRPIVTEDLRQLIAALPATLAGRRDAALLLLGFAGGFRRSELVSLDIEDLRFTSEGLIVLLRRSKTDQEGEGREVGIPYGSTPATCPVRAVQNWLADLPTGGAGPLFRPINRHGKLLPPRLTDRSVALVVKRSASAAGLDSGEVAGHSLRSGLATSAAAAGVPERAIMAQTGHRSLATLRKYIRSGSLFLENAAARVGL